MTGDDGLADATPEDLALLHCALDAMAALLNAASLSSRHRTATACWLLDVAGLTGADGEGDEGP